MCQFEEDKKEENWLSVLVNLVPSLSYVAVLPSNVC